MPHAIFSCAPFVLKIEFSHKTTDVPQYQMYTSSIMNFSYAGMGNSLTALRCCIKTFKLSFDHLSAWPYIEVVRKR